VVIARSAATRQSPWRRSFTLRHSRNTSQTAFKRSWAHALKPDRLLMRI